MNILIIGSGGREHALAWKLRQSSKLTDLFVAPGNAGTASLGRNLEFSATDADAVLRAVREHGIELVVVGPDQPLADGMVDRLAAEGVAAFGPTQGAARIEWSKAFAKEIMEASGIPTAASTSFSSLAQARDYVMGLSQPPVVKADGLALGKGVFVCETMDEALKAIDRIMEEGIFGEAGHTVVIEERLSGREVSAHAFTDGVTVRPMPFACDYKRVYDGDAGPNTGGMGAYSPPLWLDEAAEPLIHESITETAVRALAAHGSRFRGVLYPGIMMTADGPKVLEFNARFGDPETQVLLPRLKSDLLEILWAAANDRLDDVNIDWSTDACVGVVMASGGYPGDYQTGLPIAGLAMVELDVMVFHAGTALVEDGSVVTAGGRVLTVVATAPTLIEARAKAYRNVQRIHFSRAHYRKDIAAPAQDARSQ